MKKTTVLLSLFLLVFLPLGAYEKANFKLAKKWSTDNLKKMVGDHAVRPQWLHESNKFWYSYKTTAGTYYYLVDPMSKKKSLLFDNDELAGKLVAITNKTYNPLDLKLQKLELKENNREFTDRLHETVTPNFPILPVSGLAVESNLVRRTGTLATPLTKPRTNHKALRASLATDEQSAPVRPTPISPAHAPFLPRTIPRRG